MNAKIDISNTVLTTKRLVLRPWKQSDLQDFFEYASVDGVGQMAGWLPHKTIEETQEILNRFIEKKRVFALEFNGKVIGSLGIEEYVEDDFPNLKDKKCRILGYVLSKDYWGRGLMPEAVQGVIRYLFLVADLDVILCGHFLSNKQSARVQEKCGFKHYKFGTFTTKFGTTEDEEINILNKDDWQKANR